MYTDYIGFLSTHWYLTHENRKDPLENAEWVKWFVHRVTGKELDPAFIDEEFHQLSDGLIQFRNELLGLVDTIQNGTYSTANAIAILNPYLQRSNGYRLIEVNENNATMLKFESDRVDADFILADMAKGWYNLLFEMDYTRIKFCEDPECHCVFYDESKNQTKRHCTANCSNRMKVRRHRVKKLNHY